MSGFIDIYLPSSVPGYPCLSSPRFSTTITSASDGDEGRNRNWKHPLRKFKLPAGEARNWEVIADLMDMALILSGPWKSFAWRDPLDFASIRLATANEKTADILERLSPIDQNFGTGDGLTRVFQLTKLYQRGSFTYSRPILLPILDSLQLADAGAAIDAGFSVTRQGGVVTFDVAPLAGHALTWGGLFDIPVRFDSDEALDGVIQAFEAGGFAEINLDETRLC